MPFTITLSIQDSRGKILVTQVKVDAVFLAGILTDDKGGEVTSFVAGEPHDIMAAALPALTQVAAMQFRTAHHRRAGEGLTDDAAATFFQSLNIKPPPDGETG